MSSERLICCFNSVWNVIIKPVNFTLLKFSEDRLCWRCRTLRSSVMWPDIMMNSDTPSVPSNTQQVSSDLSLTSCSQLPSTSVLCEPISAQLSAVTSGLFRFSSTTLKSLLLLRESGEAVLLPHTPVTGADGRSEQQLRTVLESVDMKKAFIVKG